MLSRVGDRDRRERGQVVVLLAILIPVFFGMGAIVMDVGNWFVHKRHLQTQVDAAVLASGSEFIGCFHDPVGTNNEIRDAATRYAGDTARDSSTSNLQVQEPNDVRVVLNSASYWPDGATSSDPNTGYGLDWTADGDPASPGQDSSLPCDARFLEAKATDEDAPLLWGLIPLSPSPKSKARVEIRKLEGLSGFLPWAVPENAPRTVAALFVNEGGTPDTVMSVTLLTGPADPNDTEVRNGETVSIWDGPASASIVDRTGVIIFQSRQELEQDDFTGLTLSQICSMPTASCFSGSTITSGVEFIRGTPAGDGPVSLTTVELVTTPPPTGIGPPSPPSITPCSVTDPDSAPYYLFNADCNVRIRAQIEFGSLPTPRVVRVNGNTNCTSGTTLDLRDGWWESPWLPTIDAESGRNTFGLCWRAGTGGGAPRGNWGGQVMQMAYAAPQTRPLVSAAVRTVDSGCSLYANALNTGNQTICVEVGLRPPLRVSDGNEPPIFLRVAGSGSLNQALDCDSPPVQIEDEVRDGCRTPHAVNERDLACSPNPTWDTNNLPVPLPPPDPDPWPDCIEANPGSVTAMARGLRQRFEDPPPVGRDCPPNQWAEFRATGDLPPPDDDRWVTLVIAEYGEFDDEGIKVVPITKFAGFYATGWFIGGGTPGTQGCPDNDPPPTPPFCPRTSTNPCDADDTEVQGAVWGYFVTVVFPSAGGEPDENLCEFNELGACIAVLVE